MVQDRRHIATAKIRIPTFFNMTWGDVREAAEAASVPLGAKLDVIAHRPVNPTPLDSGDPPALEFSWDLEPREYPGD